MKTLDEQENEYKKLRLKKIIQDAIKSCVHHINNGCDCEVRCIYHKNQ